MARAGTHSAHTIKLMVMLLISLLLATDVEVASSKKKCKRCTKKFNTGSLEKAVEAFDKRPAKAEKKYGPIAGWDVSGVTDMSQLFTEFKNFNADISNWNTSGVTDMSWMFFVRSPRVPCTHSPPAVAGRPRARPLRPLLCPTPFSSPAFRAAHLA